MFWIRIYHRNRDGEKYPAALANSVHFAYSRDGVHFSPLNQNYGILFPKAHLTQENTISERGVRNLRLGRRGGEYVIWGDYVNAQDQETMPGWYYVWTTKDFLTFDELGLIGPQKDEKAGAPLGQTIQATADLPQGQELCKEQAAELSAEMGREILDAWAPLSAQRVYLPAGASIQAAEELSRVRAVLEYSDGSTDDRSVDWETDVIPRQKDGSLQPGSYCIRGKIHSPNLPYPLTIGYADPVVFSREGKWYLLATNDNLNDVGLFIRRSDTVEGLFDERATERCILSYHREKDYVQTFWAPEYHVIGGEAYILFAVGGKQWSPQCHMMKLKQGGDLLDPEGWQEPVRVLRRDGQPLTTDGITLDMTHFTAGGKDYLAWSCRYGIGTPKDTGSMICLATTDPQKPWQLTSDPVLLSRPLYGWENTAGTINNEGPYPLLTGGKVYLAFSGGSANGYSYSVGYLIADEESDLLDAASWKKHPCPVLCSHSVGIDGPGHNSFFATPEGKTMVAYHGQLHTRCAGIHRVHFNKKGFPLLNMAPERDVPKWLETVQIDVEVKE